MNDPLIGMQLANFRVDRLLGQGGMAVVYFGEDIKLHRRVAIKVLDRRYKNHPAYATRFVNEARMMAKWHHENIVQIYYADDAQGFPYYVMEYVDGQDLDAIIESYLKTGKLVPAKEVLRIGRAIAGALDYAHRHGVIHRDVKPSNILLSKDGRVLLGDFGMALEIRDGSQGNIFGTPHYISPEQAKRSADAVPQSDIYSLGVIAYELLTGDVPFNDSMPANIALQHISNPPPSPRSLNPNLSIEVESVLMKALAKDIKERYQTGAQFIEALEAALGASAQIAKTPLPPLPAGVLRREENNPAQNMSPAKLETNNLKETPRKKQGKNVLYWSLALALIFLGIGAFLFAGDRFGNSALSIAETESPTPHTGPEPASPTQTESPTATHTPLPTATSTPLPPSATFTLSPTQTIFLTPTVKYPEGSRYTLFYNETSFFILNHSYNVRSISGIKFQRLDGEGLPDLDFFGGHEWITAGFDHLPRNLCANITIYGDQDPPYLDPPECRRRLLSTVQTRFDRPRDILFWIPKGDSKQFRVIWLEEEVARCEIAAGVCEFYIP